MNLWHVYLTKQEIESRRVKSPSFAGVDIKELDLIESPGEQAPQSDKLNATNSTSDIGNTQPIIAGNHALQWAAKCDP